MISNVGWNNRLVRVLASGGRHAYEIDILEKPIERIRQTCDLMGVLADFERKLPALETDLEGLVADGETDEGRLTVNGLTGHIVDRVDRTPIPSGLSFVLFSFTLAFEPSGCHGPRKRARNHQIMESASASRKGRPTAHGRSPADRKGTGRARMSCSLIMFEQRSNECDCKFTANAGTFGSSNKPRFRQPPPKRSCSEWD